MAFIPGPGGGQIPANANAKSTGFEAEFVATPIARLQFDGGLGFADAKFRDFLSPVPGVADASGERLASPRWTANIGGQYTVPIAGAGGVLGRVDYVYRSATPPGLGDPASRSAGYGLVNARLGCTGDSGFELFLWAENLFDEEYELFRGTDSNIAFIQNINKIRRYPGAPRTYGVRAGFRF